MNKGEILLIRRYETPKTLRLLELYPEEKRDLRPSDKSRTALEMALLFFYEERAITSMIEKGVAPTTRLTDRPQTIADTVTALRTTFAATDSAIDALSEDRLNSVIDFYGNKMPLIAAIFTEVLDHIHHRGQFTIYSRLAGARVPQIYGPSADEP